jgi:hypothetical protein
MVLSVRYEEPGSLATLAEQVSHKWGRPGRGHSGAALASAHVAADLGGGCCRARKYAPGRRQLHLHHSTHRERLTWLEAQLEFPLFSGQIVSGSVRRLTGWPTTGRAPMRPFVPNSTQHDRRRSLRWSAVCVGDRRGPWFGALAAVLRCRVRHEAPECREG